MGGRTGGVDATGGGVMKSDCLIGGGRCGSSEGGEALS